jgi:hypothetical protein
MNLKKSFLLALVVVAALAAIPGTAMAANTTSLVTGVVGTELSLAAATPAAMTLTHATPGATSQVVTVTSTQASWTLTIADNNIGTNAGHMLKTLGTGSAPTGSPLNLALQWSPDGTTFHDLTGTAATVGTGALVGAKTVSLKQTLDSLDAVTLGDTYQLTLNYTAS